MPDINLLRDGDVMKVEILFDGGNGASIEKEAYGSFRIMNNGIFTIKRVTFGSGFTNNEAEYMTLIAGLEYIIAGLEERGKPSFDVELVVKGDSMLVKEQIGTYTYRDVGEILTGDIMARIYNWTGWKVNVAHLKPLRDNARRLLEQFYTFDYQHIPRKQVVEVLGH